MKKILKTTLLALISILIVTAIVGGIAVAAGGEFRANILTYPFTIKVNPPPPPDLKIEQLTDPPLEVIQGEEIRLAYRISNPTVMTRWAEVQFFCYPTSSTNGISFDVTMDGTQLIIGRPFVIAPGTSRIIEFVFRPPTGEYSLKLIIDQVPEPPPEKG